MLFLRSPQTSVNTTLNDDVDGKADPSPPTTSSSSHSSSSDFGGAFRLLRDDMRIVLLVPLCIYMGMTVTVYYSTITSHMNKEW